MKFEDFVNEETTDIVDTGKKGKQFENKFIKALEMVGLKFDVNNYAGAMWDIKPKGKGWLNLFTETPVNIKVSGTKWMFGTSELNKMLPWEKLPEKFDNDKAAAKVKRFLNKKGLADVVYLKPVAKDVQNAIIDAVDNEDVDKLKMLLNKKNFYAEKLGRGYSVRVLSNNERVTSVAIDKDGKVFMRSEKPRKLGGTMMVTFRTPTTKLGKAVQKPVIQKSMSEGILGTPNQEKFFQEIVDILDTSKSLALAKMDIVALSQDYVDKGILSLKQQVQVLELVNKLKDILK
jgi:hypothetical protein